MAAERAMSGRPPLDGAVEMTITAVFGVPTWWSRKRQVQALAGPSPR
jgi:hypothetical protein